jgi:hypothetical protein
MTLRKCGIITIIAVLLFTNSLATGEQIIETDDTGDIVYLFSTDEDHLTWQNYTGEKPNIDITEISYEVNEDKLTLMLEVNGIVENSVNISYYIYYITGTASYLMFYHNGDGYVTKSTAAGQSLLTQEINISKNSIHAIFNISGNSTNIVFWGTATEYTEYGNESKDWWGDWVPNSYFHVKTKSNQNESGDDYGSNGTVDNSNKINETETDNGFTDVPGGTPGFEIIALLVAAVLSFIFLKIKKKK